MLDPAMAAFDAEMRDRHPGVAARRGPTPAIVPADAAAEPPRRSATVHVADTLNAIGARRLAEQIRRFWAAAGFDVAVELVPMASGSDRAPCYAIRSDMVGGLPRR